MFPGGLPGSCEVVGGWLEGGRDGGRWGPVFNPPPKISILMFGPLVLGGGGAGACCCAAARIRGRLGSGLKSVMSGWLRITSFRSIFTGIGRVVAPAGTSNIWPARTVRGSPGLDVSETRALPSSVINLLFVPRLPSKMTVVPVIATVTAMFLIVPPPESFGTRSRIEPLSTFAVCPALVKLKIVFEPSRVIVISGKVSSEREPPPVLTPVSSETLSLTAAGRSSALEGSSFTSRMT